MRIATQFLAVASLLCAFAACGSDSEAPGQSASGGGGTPAQDAGDSSVGDSGLGGWGDGMAGSGYGGKSGAGGNANSGGSAGLGGSAGGGASGVGGVSGTGNSAGSSGSGGDAGVGGSGGNGQCSPGETKACYDGASGTQNVGPCKAGIATCQSNALYGDCVGQVVPATDDCKTPLDEDCDGKNDACPGTLDPGFGSGGILTISSATGVDEEGNGVVVQPDGKVVVAGVSGNALAVWRFLVNGTPDISFGTQGKASLKIGMSTEGRAVALDSSGRIVVAGSYNPNGYQHALVVRFLPEGTLDTSFAGDGSSALESLFTGSFVALALQPDNKIVAVGAGHESAWQTQPLLARFGEEGTLDNAFATGGYVVQNVGGGSVSGVAIDGAGNIVTAGALLNSAFDETHPMIMRHTPAGALDSTFGGGYVDDVFDVHSEYHTDVVIDLQGRIFASGLAQTDVTTNSGADYGLVRRLPSSQPDTTFGTNGKLAFSLSQYTSEYSRAMAATTTGQYVLVGQRYPLTASSWDGVVLRIQADGSVDTAFGNSGFVMLGEGPYEDAINDVAIAPGGSIVVVGTSETATDTDAFVARLAP